MNLASMASALVILFLTSFCGLCGAATCYPQSVSAPPATPLYRQVTDEIGRTVRVPLSVNRIVSLAPSITETIYALGAQDRLVGDTDYCDFPAEAQQKTKVGGAVNPSLEAIAALHPDLVLVTKNLNRLETVQALADLGIPSYATDPHSVVGIIDSIERLADLLGVSEVGKVVAADLGHKLAGLHDRLASLPPRRVLFIVWTEPLISIGNDTFIADALRHAGAISVVDSSQNWPQVNLEAIVQQQPEFLIFAESHVSESPRSATALAGLPGWRLLNAVRSQRFVTISDAINRPAPRLIAAIEDLAHQLHPEAFVEEPHRDPDQPGTLVVSTRSAGRCRRPAANYTVPIEPTCAL